MTNLEKFYPESRVGGFTDVDGTVVFFSRVQSLVRPSDVVLDVGCGRGEYQDDPVEFRRQLRILRSRAKTVIGIDMDQAAASNPFLDEFRLIDGDTWPVDESAIDLIVCDQVLEHVARPDQFFAESRRVLRDGGHLCIRTTNVWSYVGIASRLVPNRHHARVTTTVQERRKGEDVFPTEYKCNSIRRVRRMMKAHGFEPIVYGYEAEPSYLAFSNLAYRLGVIHQRLAPRFMRLGIFAFGRLRKGQRT
jgi:SAM-dependent methyltransferase